MAPGDSHASTHGLRFHRLGRERRGVPECRFSGLLRLNSFEKQAHTKSGQSGAGEAVDRCSRSRAVVFQPG